LDPQSQVSEWDSDNGCKTSEVLVIGLSLWTDASSSDESSVNFCSLNI